MVATTRLFAIVTSYLAMKSIRVAQQQLCRAAVYLQKLTLTRQADDVRIIEKVEQEVFNIIKRFWATQIEQQHSNFVSCASWLLNLQIR